MLWKRAAASKMWLYTNTFFLFLFLSLFILIFFLFRYQRSRAFSRFHGPYNSTVSAYGRGEIE